MAPVKKVSRGKNDGPPWSNLLGKSIYRYSFLEPKSVESLPCKSVLGQGMVEYWVVKPARLCPVRLALPSWHSPDLHASARHWQAGAKPMADGLGRRADLAVSGVVKIRMR